MAPHAEATYKRRTCPVCKGRYQPPPGPRMQSCCDACEAIVLPTYEERSAEDVSLLTEMIDLAREISEDRSYSIIRFHFDESHPDHRMVVADGLTIDEVQEHCRRDDTHGDGWFDGYTSKP